MSKINKSTYALAAIIVIAVSSSWNAVGTYFDKPPVVQVAPNSFLAKITDEFNKIENNDDRLLIHKLFAGAGSFLEVCETLDGTYQFDPILAKVQTSYGWDREKYPKFTDAISNYLVDVGYDIPKPLKTKEERLAFAKIFKNLGEATKYE